MSRILYLLMLVLLLLASPLEASTLHDTSRFELRNGFIVVYAQVDGKYGRFILDTGAPGLIINARRFFGEGEEIALTGTGGATVGQVLTDRNFRWKGIELTGIDAIALDLDYLENSVQAEIFGLIGMNLFEGRDLMIDYTTNTFHVGESACYAGSQQDLIKLPLVMYHHIPTVSIGYMNRTFTFGIDTGSRLNMISAPAYDLLAQSDVLPLGLIRMTGADRQTVIAQTVEVHGLSAENARMRPEQFILYDLGGFDDGATRLHGILGHDFFDGRKVWINADRTQLFLEKGAFDYAVFH